MDPAAVDAAPVGGRRRLEPDPQVRAAILAAAARIVRADGLGALSVAAVLGRARLGTRAFYRHFDSKDDLVAALFLDMARAEMERTRIPMEAAADPVRAVVAWLDGRLDLAFDDDVVADLRRMSLEAQSQMFAAPQLVAAAYGEILHPLIEILCRGKELGLFADIDPVTEAQSMHGVVWANVNRQWSASGSDRNGIAELRDRVQRFCLRGLGVAAETIESVLADRNRTTNDNR